MGRKAGTLMTPAGRRSARTNPALAQPTPSPDASAVASPVARRTRHSTTTATYHSSAVIQSQRTEGGRTVTSRAAVEEHGELGRDPEDVEESVERSYSRSRSDSVMSDRSMASTGSSFTEDGYTDVSDDEGRNNRTPRKSMPPLEIFGGNDSEWDWNLCLMVLLMVLAAIALVWLLLPGFAGRVGCEFIGTCPNVAPVDVISVPGENCCAQVAQSAKHIGELRNRLDRVDGTISSLDSRLGGLIGTTKNQLVEQIESFSRDLETHKSSTSDTFKSTASRLDSLTDTIADLEARLKEVASTSTSNNGQDAMKENIAVLFTKVDALAVLMSASGDDAPSGEAVSRLNGQLQSIKAELQQELADLAAKMENGDAKVAEAAKLKLAGVEDQLTALKAADEELKGADEAAAQATSELTQSVDESFESVKKSIEALRARLSELETGVATDVERALSTATKALESAQASREVSGEGEVSQPALADQIVSDAVGKVSDEFSAKHEALAVSVSELLARIELVTKQQAEIKDELGVAVAKVDRDLKSIVTDAEATDSDDRKLDDNKLADGTGLVDYALGSLGGVVITDLSVTSPTNNETSNYWASACRQPHCMIDGLAHNPAAAGMRGQGPANILDPDLTPGRCWPMAGSDGFVTVRLWSPVVITAVSIDHVHPDIVPNRNSAIDEFEVYGMEYANDNDPTPLGGPWHYDIEGGVTQVFEVEQARPQSQKRVSYVQLRVLSNHGNDEMTCIYRFRVHGKSE